LLAFIHVAKTGGQTVAVMLRSSFGLKHCDATFLEEIKTPADPFAVKFVVPKFDANDFQRLQKYWPRMRSISGHPIALWSELDNIRPDTQYFALVREPIKRGASHFQYHVRHDKPCLDWDRWLQWDVHQNHQVKMFSKSVDANDAIQQIKKKNVFVGLTERFDESFVMFKALFANDLNIAYIRINTAKDNSIAHELLANSQTREQIRDMYRADLELYEFVAHELYPSFQKEYGPNLERDVQAFRESQRNAVNQRNILLNRAYRRLVFKPLQQIYRWQHR
jgi:hypothetical protein